MSRLERAARRAERLAEQTTTSPAVYPSVATVHGAQLRLRIEALDTPPTQGSGSDLSATLNGSHRLHVPPGVTLHPGDVLITGTGERYQVVPPLERDPLGDTLGGSLLLVAHAPTPDPPVNPDPTPATPDPSSPPDDGWWREGLP